MSGVTAEVGVFGGSGFYSFLDDVEALDVDTPYGPPSAAVTVGTIGERRVAFLPRHGAAHEFPAHRVNARANVWAMARLGVSRILGPCAAGSLQPGVHPGDFVVLDQLVDRTSGREATYYDGPALHHISFADPYCPQLGALATKACRSQDVPVHEAGTVVVVQGPRFSTRAESNWFRAQGWEVVNMTQYPESALARELGICYAGIALITDYDTGVEGIEGVEPVSQEEVFAVLEANVERVRSVLFELIPRVPADRDCTCGQARGPLPHRIEPVRPRT